MGEIVKQEPEPSLEVQDPSEPLKLKIAGLEAEKEELYEMAEQQAKVILAHKEQCEELKMEWGELEEKAESAELSLMEQKATNEVLESTNKALQDQIEALKADLEGSELRKKSLNTIPIIKV